MNSYKIRTIYDKNETMKLLGNQQAVNQFWANTKVKADVENILKARDINLEPSIICDIFMLGYMNGKRAKRIR